MQEKVGGNRSQHRNMHAHIVIAHTNRYRYRVRRIQGFVNFYTNRGRTFPCVSVKSTKIYFKVSLHARDTTPASERSHERFMLTKSPLTHTTTTHRRRRGRRDGDGRRRNEKSSSSEINLRNEFNTSKLEQPTSLENRSYVLSGLSFQATIRYRIFIRLNFRLCFSKILIYWLNSESIGVRIRHQISEDTVYLASM